MFTSVATFFALTASVRAIAFNGPTPTNDLFVDINGFSPKTTNEPRSLPELFRRQADDSLCGYLEGDGEYPVSCSTGACMYNTVINWFGCCTGTVADSCNIATRCVGAASVSSCIGDPSCSNDNYLLACTESSAPFCAQMYSVVSQNTVGHFVCARTSALVEVLSTSEGASAAPTLRSSTGLGSAKPTSTPVTSARPSTRRSSSSSEDEESTSVRVAATRSTTGATTTAPSATRQDTASSTTASTGGAAMQTAKAIVGGLVGAVALLF